MSKSAIANHRDFLKDSLRQKINFHLTDQNQGLEPPPVQKPPQTDQEIIRLPGLNEMQGAAGTDLFEAINNRRSHRRFRNEPVSLVELAFLLWATQGIKGIIGPGSALRTVPSAGCRHAFESYLLISDVADLKPGIYRYLPVEHALVQERQIGRELLHRSLDQATLNQTFVATAPVCFVWTVLPYRMEWRYQLAAHRVILIDVGHLCQNLYLACEAIGCGTCAIAAYHQELMDKFLRVDGEDEFTLYLAPVGKV